ncbi:MAG TPA: universal stress protein [Terriglobales bacterium]|jgi:nucleotide-binding universal stress UspA family protein|nr:universal stress protein [Terriglobales bacterium]
MSILKKILAPTDFSDLSAKGVRYACRLAKEVGAEVVVLNVVVLDESNAVDKREMTQHEKRLDEFVSQGLTEISAEVKVRKRVVAGLPYNAIVDCAESEHADLIVMSSHGRSGLSRMLIGSVTDKILRSAPSPVLVVPSHE